MTLRTETWFDQYNKFADACGLEKGNLLDRPNFPAIALGKRLVEEEWEQETKEALEKYYKDPSLENLVEVADGITDSIYVLCQLARALGVPLNATWNEVQYTNMAKVDPETGEVKRRDDGKILKPPGWQPPNIWGILKYETDRLSVQAKKNGAENWKSSAIFNSGE